jgi:membrane protease subunit HflK
MKSPWDNDNFSNKIFSNFNKDFIPNNFFDVRILILAALGFIAIWALSGFYTVKDGEEALVIRFGSYNRKAYAGLNYHLPSPIEEILIERVDKSRRIEIGYRSNEKSYKYKISDEDNSSDNFKSVPQESIMLTGDENILNLNCDVMWHISDLRDYAFNVLNPDDSIKLATESAIREVISKTPIASVLSTQKQEVADLIQNLAQSILNNYKIGVEIERVQLLKAEPPVQVIQYYVDVQTAKADKQREINQAYAYSNDMIPKARGEAAKVTQEAEGYKQAIISEAEGQSKRFDSILTEYTRNKNITRDRLYFDTVEYILRDANKTIIEGQTLPHMSIMPEQGK